MNLEKKNSESLNFVYCIDNNFNKQAFLSVASLFKTNQNENISVFIIHKSPKSFNKYINKLNKIYPQKNIHILKFKYNIKNYPNLKKAHVSEATYYRMFLGEHIECSSDFISYIDADAYFVNNISKKFNEIFVNLRKNDLLLAAKTEHFYKQQSNLEVFERLNINFKYFNAGIMIINLKKWKKDNLSEKLRERVFELNDKIKFWDQDVLNSVLNGSHYELPNELNYLVDINYPEELKEKKIDIIHYAGKIKPWSKRGLKINTSTYYQLLNQEFLR